MKSKYAVQPLTLLAMTSALGSGMLAQVGCSSTSPDEQLPGETAHLDYELAVDPRTDTVFSLQTFFEPTPTPSVEADPAEVSPSPAPEPVLLARDLYAIHPQTGKFQTLGNVFDVEAISLLFPKDRVMMTGYLQGEPLLRLYNPNTLELEKEAFPPISSWGSVSVAPGGDAFITRDYTDEPEEYATLTLSSLETLEAHTISLGDTIPSVVWSPTEDRLVLSFLSVQPETETYSMRLLSWSLEALKSNGYQLTSEGLWAGASVDVSLPNQQPNGSFYGGALTSPDGRYAVLPTATEHPVDADEDGVAEDVTYEHNVQVISLESGALRTLPELYGPVNFTPDGTTLVALRLEMVTLADGSTESEEVLVMVDLETFAYEEAPLTGADSLQYFVTRDGNFVVIDAEPTGEEDPVTGELVYTDTDLLIYNLDSGEMRTLANSQVEILDYISRPAHGEVWSISGSTLNRIDYVAGTLTPITTSWTSRYIHYLPNMDKLVLMERGKPVLRVVDPEALLIQGAIELPTPEGL